MRLSDTLQRTQQRNLSAENARLRYELTQARLEAAALREAPKVSPTTCMAALWKRKAKDWRSEALKAYETVEYLSDLLGRAHDLNDRQHSRLFDEGRAHEDTKCMAALWKQAAKMYRWSYRFQARILEEAGCYALTERSVLRDQLTTLAVERDKDLSLLLAKVEAMHQANIVIAAERDEAVAALRAIRPLLYLAKAHVSAEYDLAPYTEAIKEEWAQAFDTITEVQERLDKLLARCDEQPAPQSTKEE